MARIPVLDSGDLLPARFLPAEAARTADVAALSTSVAGKETPAGAQAKVDALDVEVAGYVGPLRSRLFAAVGDSITDYDRNLGAEPNSYFNDWPTRLQEYAAGSLILVKNAAVGGRKTSDVLAAFDTDMAGLAPALILDMSGTNDARDGIATVASFITNKLAILDKIRALGAQPLWVTIPPQGVGALPTPAAPALEVKTTGGTLPAGTYSYRVTAVRANGTETLPSTAATIVVPSGTTNQVRVTVTPQEGAAGYKVYGRVSGSELRIVNFTGTSWNGQPSTAFLDSGSTTPAGALPVSNTTAVAKDTTITGKLDKINAWMRRYAVDNGIPLVDFHSLVVDPTTGLYGTQYTRDGIHPTPPRSNDLAAAAWAALSSKTLPAVRRTAAAAVDSSSFAINPLFLAGLTPWVHSDQETLGVPTSAPETRAGFAGQAIHITANKVPTAALTIGIQSPNTSMPNTNFAPGDVLEIAYRVEIANNVGAQLVVSLFTYPGNVTLYRALFNGANLPPVQVVKRIVATSENLVLSVRVNSGTADVYFGEFKVTNLTAAGAI